MLLASLRVLQDEENFFSLDLLTKITKELSRNASV